MGKADFAKVLNSEYGLKKRTEIISPFRVSKEEKEIYLEVIKELEKRNITSHAEAFVWMVQHCHHHLDKVKMNKLFNRDRRKKI